MLLPRGPVNARAASTPPAVLRLGVKKESYTRGQITGAAGFLSWHDVLVL